MSWLGAAIVILIIALSLQLGMLAYAMYALVGIILVSRLMTQRWSESLTAERELSKVEAESGDVVGVIAKVTNQGGLPIAWALLEDLLPLNALVHNPPNLKITGRRVMLSSVRSGKTKSILYKMKCNRRGYYQIGPLIMETGDLFGLHRRYRVLTKPTFLTVYPKVTPLDGYDISSRRPLGEVRMTHRLYEDPTRNAGVREYEPGDPLNRVHWGATARTGKLHSKIYEPSTVAGATIVLDFHASSHPKKNEPVRSEIAISAVASLCHYLYDMGQQVGMITNGRDAADRVREEGWDYDLRSRSSARNSASMMTESDRLRPQIFAPERGPEQLQRLQTALARVELTDGIQFDQLILETACRMPKDATVIAVLQTVEERYAVSLGNLRRQGYAVAAIINTYDTYDFAQLSKYLLAEGIATYHLSDETAIAEIAKAHFFGVRA